MNQNQESIQFCTELEASSIADSIAAAAEENPNNVGPPTEAELAAGMSNVLNGIDAPSIAAIWRKLWKPGRTLQIAFLGSVNSTVKDKIIHHAEGWLNHANIKFNFISGDYGDIRITTTPGGSWSYVGTDAKTINRNDPTMNYGWLYPNTSDDEYSRVVLHEFGHALGCIHEHQHTDAGIPWNREAVYAYYARQGWSRQDVDHNIFRRYSASQLNASSYDRDSIMHYAVPNELTIGNWSIGWNRILSNTDETFIKKLYPSPNAIDIPVTPSDEDAISQDTQHTIQCNQTNDPLHGVLLSPDSQIGLIVPSHPGIEGETLESVEGFTANAEEMAFGDDFLPEEEVDLDDIPHISALVKAHHATAESVCGADERKQLTDTTEFPFRATCSLLMDFGGDKYIGTGWFISPDTVVTCGHCVFDKEVYGWADSIRVMPGRNGSKLPFGSLTSRQFYSVKGWLDSEDHQYDYAVIKLPDSKLGRRVGYYGFSNPSTAELELTKLNNVGYPGDKPSGTPWYNAGKTRLVKEKKIHYMMDTAGGQSGSSVYLKLPSDPAVGVGVHGYGGCPNSARRIDGHTIANLRRWANR